jgi:hypothetical protein
MNLYARRNLGQSKDSIMSLPMNLKFLRSFSACLISAGLLVSCGHLDAKNGQDAKEVEIEGVAYVVSKTGKDIYTATHRDWLQNNFVVSPSEFITRKIAFIAAIEKYSGCKVAVSDFGGGHSSLNASVTCN